MFSILTVVYATKFQRNDKWNWEIRLHKNITCCTGKVYCQWNCFSAKHKAKFTFRICRWFTNTESVVAFFLKKKKKQKTKKSKPQYAHNIPQLMFLVLHTFRIMNDLKDFSTKLLHSFSLINSISPSAMSFEIRSTLDECYSETAG